MRANHTIFTSPLAVDLTLQVRDEDEKEGYTGGTWLVHEGDYPDVDVGMVSDGHGFEDSPDCERIAGGVNSKGPAAVAIGREANLLQWGFYGAPDRMTVPAKRAFLNAIVWMKQFHGQRPLVEKKGRSREWFAQFAAMLDTYRGQDQVVNSLKKQFPAELVADGVDTAKLRKWYADNEEYFGPGKDRWSCAVDADLARLKLSNRKPEFLDWLLATLGKEPNDATALRLANRYLGEHGRDASAVKQFVDENRELLFFSDTAGFRWLVDENRQRLGATKR